MSRSNDGPKPFGSLRHLGNIGAFFGDSNPAAWNEKAGEEAKLAIQKAAQRAIPRKINNLDKTLLKNFTNFTTTQALNHLRDIRWKSDINCPNCISLKIIRRPPEWCCIDCGNYFDELTGTGIQKDEIKKWFKAGYLISTDSINYTPETLSRILAVSLSSAMDMHKYIQSSFNQPTMTSDYNAIILHVAKAALAKIPTVRRR